MGQAEVRPSKATARKEPGTTGALSKLPGGLELRVFSEMEEGGPNPLSLMATALSSCRAVMFDRDSRGGPRREDCTQDSGAGQEVLPRLQDTRGPEPGSWMKSMRPRRQA